MRLRKLPPLLSDPSGSAILLFALLMPVLLMSIGVSVDVSRAYSKKLASQSALDAAIIAGIAAANQVVKSGQSTTNALSAAKSAAAASLAANQSKNATVEFSIKDGKITGTGNLSTTATTSFLNIFGYKTIPVIASSEATGGLSSFINVYLLVDVSSSMLLPSTTAGINAMRSATGCALACHENATGNDSYKYAIKNNITLRYQVVAEGVRNLLDYLNDNSIYADKVKVGLWSFDHELNQQAALTSNFISVKAKFPDPSIATDDETAATPFDSYISSFVSTVGKAGDGTTALSPKKLIILATDGVNDPTRAWTYNVPLRSQVRVFNTSFCSTLAANGVTLAIIYTPYYPMTWDWGYNATLGQPGSLGGATRVDDIPIALKACAGSNYIAASDQAAIQSAFTTLFQKSQPIQLTK